MAPEAECESEMSVRVRWRPGKLAVPLAQLNPQGAEAVTRQAIGGWHDWVSHGYEL